MSALYLAANKRDGGALDIFLTPRKDRADVWASIDMDFACEIDEPDWSIPSSVSTLSEALDNANGEPIECVLLTRARYDELTKIIKEARATPRAAGSTRDGEEETIGEQPG